MSSHKESRSSSNRELHKLLKKQTRLLEKIHAQNKVLIHRTKMNQIIGAIRLLIILAPIILAIIFLPPVIKDIASKYNEIGGLLEAGTPGDVAQIIKQFVPMEK